MKTKLDKCWDNINPTNDHFVNTFFKNRNISGKFYLKKKEEKEKLSPP